MPIDPDLADYLARVAAEVPPSASGSPAARRARLEAVARRFPYPADNVERRDHWLHLPGRELLVRVYRPGAGRLPVILYLHGGGWVAGSVESHDGTCATLASDANAVVASVQYRRAPENPWPAPNDDAFGALQWLARSARDLDVDEQRMAVSGDSAGAHLALGAAIEARDRGGPALALQLLIYPVVEPDFESGSYREHAVSPTLTRADMIEFWNHYLPNASERATTAPFQRVRRCTDSRRPMSSSLGSIRFTTRASRWWSDCGRRRCRLCSSTSRRSLTDSCARRRSPRAHGPCSGRSDGQWARPCGARAGTARRSRIHSNGPRPGSRPSAARARSARWTCVTRSLGASLPGIFPLRKC